MKSTYTLIGCIVGIALFLSVGLIPSMLYGGYAGVMLASGIFGAPLAPTILAKSMVVFGMVMGVLAVGSLFAVSGAAGGAAVGLLGGWGNRVPVTTK